MRLRIPIVLILLIGFVRSANAAPAGQVKLEVVGDVQLGAAMSFQEWGQALNQAGIQNFRLRGATESDKPSIEVQSTHPTPVYVVTAILGPGDTLIVPGAKFRRGDMKRLAAWLEDIAKRGPLEKREPIVAFGMTASQLFKVNDDLAKPTGFATLGMSRADAVAKIAAQLRMPLKIEGELAGADSGDDKIEEDLSHLSCGTALACILRPAGFCMVPREAGESFEYGVAKARLDQEVWPVGWPAKSPQEALPALYEFRNVNVSGVSAAKVIEVVARQLKVPVLYDHNALARHDIDPEKVMVSHPAMRTNYSLALRKMLAKAGLKFELRVDEAEKPLIWISTLKPV